MNRAVPHSPEAEEAVLGVCLLTRPAVDHAVGLLTPEDFYVPTYAAVFAAICVMADTGAPVDAKSLAIHLAAQGRLDGLQANMDGTTYQGRDVLVQLAARAPISANADHYARLVVEHATRRALIAAAARVAETAYDTGTELADVVTVARDQIDRATVPVGGDPDPDVDTFVSTGPLNEPWVLPNLLQRQERLLLVAAPGAGKSTVQRQIGLLASAGLDPFRWTPIPRQRVAIIDLENPAGLMRRKMREMTDGLHARTLGQQVPEFDPSWLRICARTEGIDLLKRSDQLWLADRAAANAKTMGGLDLLCVGPLYKMDAEADFTGEGARRVQAAIDGIRRRHGCAVILETHAPHESFGQKSPRALRPAGSRLWLNWPEFCRGFEPHDHAGLVDFYDVRSPRDARPWPKVLRRDAKPWPWVEDGYETEVF